MVLIWNYPTWDIIPLSEAILLYKNPRAKSRTALKSLVWCIISLRNRPPTHTYTIKRKFEKKFKLVNSLGCPQKFDNKTVLLKTTHSLVTGLEETRRFIIFSVLEDAT